MTVPGDPNADNKRVVSNFGNVKARTPYIDLSVIRRNILEFEVPIMLRVVPRLMGLFTISRADVKRQEQVMLQPNAVHQDLVRLYPCRHDATLSFAKTEDMSGNGQLTAILRRKHDIKSLQLVPSLEQQYDTPADSLPPGVAGRPMVTLIHETEDGLALGGVTYLVTEEG